MIDSTLIVPAANKDIICKLEPYQCSFQAFDEDVLRSSQYVNLLIAKKVITLQDTHTFIEHKKKEHNYPGQKYKLGTKGYLVGPNQIACEIIKYNPADRTYIALITKTGGKFTITADQFTLTPTKQEDLKDNGDDIDNIEALNANDNSEISQAPAEDDFEILNTPYGIDAEDENSESADSIIRQYDSGRMQTDGKDAEVIYKMNKKASQENNDEDTFIIKKDGEVFAQEVPNKKVLEDTAAEINDAFSKIKKERAEEELGNIKKVKTFRADIPEDLKNWLACFLDQETRKQKVEVVNMTSSEEDIAKLNLVAEYAEEGISDLAIDILAKMKKENVSKTEEPITEAKPKKTRKPKTKKK